MVTLKQGQGMDPQCPNFGLHCVALKPSPSNAVSTRAQHHISAEQVVRELLKYIWVGKIRDVMEPIVGHCGSTAQLFRIVHPKYGYAFAGKGANNIYTDALEHEEKIYDHICEVASQRVGGLLHHYLLISKLPLRPDGLQQTDLSCHDDNKLEHKQIQVQVPILFGIIKPKREHIKVMYPFWPLPGQVHLDEVSACNTFLLLSYHGNCLLEPLSMERVCSKLTWSLPLPTLQKPVQGHFCQQILDEAEDHATCVSKKLAIDWLLKECELVLGSFGIVHSDLAMHNLLWSERLHLLMIINFGQSVWTESSPCSRKTGSQALLSPTETAR